MPNPYIVSAKKIEEDLKKMHNTVKAYVTALDSMYRIQGCEPTKPYPLIFH